MVSLYNKASEGAQDLLGLAGRIGKQVQNLRGTAAVMAESGPKHMSLRIFVSWEDTGLDNDTRAGRPAFRIHMAG